MEISLRTIPANLPTEAIKGFAISFAIEALATGNPTFGLVAGSLAIVATIIHTVVTPLFRQITQKEHLHWVEEMIRWSFAFLGMGCAATTFGNYKVLDHLVGNYKVLDHLVGNLVLRLIQMCLYPATTRSTISASPVLVQLIF